MVDAQPGDQPHEAERAGEGEGPPPPDEGGEHGHHDGGDGAADAGATVEDGDGDTTLLGGEPFGYGLAGAGPVESFANAEKETAGGEAGDRIDETRAGIHH